MPGTLVGRIRDLKMKPQFETIEKAGFHNVARYEHEQPEILAGFGTDFKLAASVRTAASRAAWRRAALPPRPGAVSNPL